VFGATVVGLTARASEVVGFRKNGALRRGSSKVDHTDAVAAEEDGAITAAERTERIISGTSSRYKIVRREGRERSQWSMIPWFR
jgi:hypothetical protein